MSIRYLLRLKSSAIALNKGLTQAILIQTFSLLYLNHAQTMRFLYIFVSAKEQDLTSFAKEVSTYHSSATGREAEMERNDLPLKVRALLA